MNETIETVLIVEDKKTLADQYASVLGQEYEVITAYSGEEALEVANEDVDAVFLDRKMPGVSGGEVLDRLRDRGRDWPVAMLTAVRPDWDVVGMGFDDYLLKPVDVEGLHDAVERLGVIGGIDREVREYVRQTIKQATLEGEKDVSELEANETFEMIKAEIAEKSSELGDVTAGLSATETQVIIGTITQNLSSSGGPSSTNW